ncbi:hypothetical protein L3Q82_016221 [Scortum barcoo]|uniref:Uncharacterized protein n=1 Tax=Scortum barcoo TaxID=214431 RepID=A0ACB8VTJ0_9TELE|nr:hypothetical protein L3Q82_016221 [Scortum barcoo]
MHREESAEVAWASICFPGCPLDALPREGVPGMSHREEAQGKTQDTLERLCLSAGLGTPRRSPRKSWRKCLGTVSSAQTGRSSGRAAVREGEVDLEEYTSAVLGYISKCTEDVTSTRTVTGYPNQKPWLNAEVRSLLKARDAAFRSGDRLALRAARRQLTAGVKRAKAAYAQRIQGHFTSNESKEYVEGHKVHHRL